VDNVGNPAYIGQDRIINWKKEGTWIKITGCANFIAFGGDGTLFKKNCEEDTYTYKYQEATEKWKQLG
jgi:hypothetical protein